MRSKSVSEQLRLILWIISPTHNPISIMFSTNYFYLMSNLENAYFRVKAGRSWFLQLDCKTVSHFLIYLDFDWSIGSTNFSLFYSYWIMTHQREQDSWRFLHLMETKTWNSTNKDRSNLLRQSLKYRFYDVKFFELWYITLEPSSADVLHTPKVQILDFRILGRDFSFTSVTGQF